MKASPISKLICVSEIFRSRVIGWTRSGSALLSMKATALTVHITIAMPQGAEGGDVMRCVAFSSTPASRFCPAIGRVVFGYAGIVIPGQPVELEGPCADSTWLAICLAGPSLQDI